MAAQRSLALGVGARLQLVRHVLEHLDVGHDALGLDRLARRRVVAGGGQPQRAVAASQRNDGLHRALAERARADDGRALVVLQCASDDFRRRGRAAIDQHDDRLALGQVARMRGAALGLLGVAAAGRHDLALLQERVGDGDRFLEQAARIVAEVDDVALELVTDLVREVGDLALQAFGGLLVEGGDADIGDVVLLDARAHRADADVVAHQGDVDRIVLTLADDLELDLGVDRAAHLLDGLVESQALHRLVVEIGDDVIGHDAGAGGRRVVDRRDHLDQTVFHRDLDAEAAELTAGLHLHVAEALGVHVARMRIEAGEHAADGGFDQLGVVGLLDIVGAHALEDVAEQIELTIGVRSGGSRAGAHEHRARLGHEQRQRRTGGGAEEDY